MIYLITGVPGAGKTLRAIYHLSRFLKDGRTVYADIDGLSIPGVLPGVEDWRDTPDGSVVVYDECQKRFGPDKGQGRSDNPIIAAFELHRHTGHDIILITQHPGLLHAHVRRLVGRHEHLTRAHGWGWAMVYGRDQLIDRFTPTALKACDSQLWKHPQDYYAVYHSASEHTHKARLPWKLVGMGLVVIIGGSLVAWKLSQMDITHLVEPVAVSVPPPSHAQAVNSPLWERPQPTGRKVADTVGGCIVSARACRCYTGDMLPLDLSDGDCRDIASKPLAFSAKIGGRSGDRRGAADAPPGAPPPLDAGRRNVAM